MLGLCATIVVLSLTLVPSTEAVSIFGWEVPALCAVRNLFGIGCPGCGITRSFVFLGHGDLSSALSMNWLGPAVYALVWTQLPYRVLRLVRGYRERAAVVAVAGSEGSG
jgi:hypothetical protein